MKRNGILNSRLSQMIASMGHTDRMVICDSGLPIPREAEAVDLALTINIPRFVDTLKAVLSELEVEQAVVAKEMSGSNRAVYDEMCRTLGEIPLRKVSHADFKKMTNGNGKVYFVRTGETTPFANIILVSGVTFPAKGGKS